LSSETTVAATCRTCPKCGVAIYKLSGCDAMRCGSDMYAYGKRRVGCGAEFSWALAKPYIPSKVQLSVSSIPKPAEVIHRTVILYQYVRLDS
jgi:hypothetical protein